MEAKLLSIISHKPMFPMLVITSLCKLNLSLMITGRKYNNFSLGEQEYQLQNPQDYLFKHSQLVFDLRVKITFVAIAGLLSQLFPSCYNLLLHGR